MGTGHPTINLEEQRTDYLTQILIFLSLSSGVNLRYFNLWLFDPVEFIDWNIKFLRYQVWIRKLELIRKLKGILEEKVD